MFDIKGFFSTDEIKVGAGVATGIYVTEFGASLLKGYVAKLAPEGEGNTTVQFIISALLKGLVGSLLYNYGKEEENLFVRYMAAGAWTSIILDAFKMFLPSAQSMAMQMTGRAPTSPMTIVTPASTSAPQAIGNKKK